MDTPASSGLRQACRFYFVATEKRVLGTLGRCRAVCFLVEAPGLRGEPGPSRRFTVPAVPWPRWPGSCDPFKAHSSESSPQAQPRAWRGGRADAEFCRKQRNSASRKAGSGTRQKRRGGAGLVLAGPARREGAGEAVGNPGRGAGYQRGLAAHRTRGPASASLRELRMRLGTLRPAHRRRHL